MKEIQDFTYIVFVALLVFSMGCGLVDSDGFSPPPEEPSPPSNQVLDGRRLVEERCVTCHSMDRIERRFGQDIAFWESTVDRMLGKRNMLNESERRAVLDYLIDP